MRALSEETEERVFQVEKTSGMCKGPAAELVESMVDHGFGRAGKALPLSLLCQTGVKTAACRPASIPEPQGR